MDWWDADDRMAERNGERGAIDPFACEELRV